MAGPFHHYLPRQGPPSIQMSETGFDYAGNDVTGSWATGTTYADVSGCVSYCVAESVAYFVYVDSDAAGGLSRQCFCKSSNSGRVAGAAYLIAGEAGWSSGARTRVGVPKDLRLHGESGFGGCTALGCLERLKCDAGFRRTGSWSTTSNAIGCEACPDGEFKVPALCPSRT